VKQKGKLLHYCNIGDALTYTFCTKHPMPKMQILLKQLAACSQLKVCKWHCFNFYAFPSHCTNLSR